MYAVKFQEKWGKEVSSFVLLVTMTTRNRRNSTSEVGIASSRSLSLTVLRSVSWNPGHSR